MNFSQPGSSNQGDSPGKNTGMGCHALFQEIFPTQGSKPYLLCLMHWEADSLPLVPPRKPSWSLWWRHEVKLLSRIWLWNRMDCSLPGFSIHGIFQARVLEWVAISFSRGSSWPRDWTQVSRIADRHNIKGREESSYKLIMWRLKANWLWSESHLIHHPSTFCSHDLAKALTILPDGQAC